MRQCWSIVDASANYRTDFFFCPLALFRSFICLTLLLVLFSQKSSVGRRVTVGGRPTCVGGVPFHKGLSCSPGRIGVCMVIPAVAILVEKGLFLKLAVETQLGDAAVL